jgi:hypothetical protein
VALFARIEFMLVVVSQWYHSIEDTINELESVQITNVGAKFTEERPQGETRER